MGPLRNQIFNGECKEILSKIPKETFDMIISSPPYDNLRNYNGFKFEFYNIAEQLFRTLKKGRVLVWIVNDATINGSETGSSFKQVLKFMEIGFNLHDTMIFRKTNPIPQIYRKRYNAEFEYMFVLSKGNVTVHNPIKIPCLHAGRESPSSTYKNFSAGKQSRNKFFNTVKNDKIKGNVWDYVIGKKDGSKGHPAPFPVQLAIDHIISWTNEGDFILDPMCGSGTSCVAAKMQNRNFMGIDISKDYCELSRSRIDLGKAA